MPVLQDFLNLTAFAFSGFLADFAVSTRFFIEMISTTKSKTICGTIKMPVRIVPISGLAKISAMPTKFPI